MDAGVGSPVREKLPQLVGCQDRDCPALRSGYAGTLQVGPP
jgi:hypothetical protein